MQSAEPITAGRLHWTLVSLATELTTAAFRYRIQVARTTPVPDDAPVWDAIATARVQLRELAARRQDAPLSEGEDA